MENVIADLLGYALASGVGGVIVGLLSGPSSAALPIDAPPGTRAGAAGVTGAGAGISGGLMNALIASLLSPGASLAADCLRGALACGTGGAVAGAILTLLLGARLRQPEGNRRVGLPIVLGGSGLLGGCAYVLLNRWTM